MTDQRRRRLNISKPTLSGAAGPERFATKHCLANALLIIVLALVAACSSDNSAPSSPSSLPPSPSTLPTLTFTNASGESVALSVEIAGTPEQRGRGLMSRESLAEDAGMLFIFESDTQAGFWMKDTLIPLSIAFIDVNGTIVHIEDMQPQTTNLHVPPQAYRYAVEVNQRWYERKGIEVGDHAKLPTSGD